MDMDFRLYDYKCEQLLGVTTFEGEGRIIIFPHQHEAITSIIDTINHEAIHYCIGEDESIDPYQEHALMYKLQWINEYIV